MVGLFELFVFDISVFYLLKGRIGRQHYQIIRGEDRIMHRHYHRYEDDSICLILRYTILYHTKR